MPFYFENLYRNQNFPRKSMFLVPNLYAKNLSAPDDAKISIRSMVRMKASPHGFSCRKIVWSTPGKNPERPYGFWHGKSYPGTSLMARLHDALRLTRIEISPRVDFNPPPKGRVEINPGQENRTNVLLCVSRARFERHCRCKFRANGFT